MKLALFGGLYSNYLALEQAIADATSRGVDGMCCLGDLGAFGPHPNRVFPILLQHNVACVQGNYDDSIGNELNDCQCGYTDPKDNYFAQLSYDYTLANTNDANKSWLRELPREIRIEVDGLRVLLCHGSPRRTNEFLWESTTSTAFLNRLADEHDADIIVGTHSGIHWERELGGGRRYINVGVLGRPENDGTTNVWYSILHIGASERQSVLRSEPILSQRPTGATPAIQQPRPQQLTTPTARRGSRPNALPCTTRGRSVNVAVEFVPVEYDHHRLAQEMRAEELPDEFIQTVLTGWWTTCLEILPSRERRRGRF